jgi:hypothetical protein
MGTFLIANFLDPRIFAKYPREQSAMGQNHSMCRNDIFLALFLDSQNHVPAHIEFA